MKRKWAGIAAKIDVLSRRERGILFVTAALLAGMLVYFPLLEPQLAKQKKLSQQLTELRGKTADVQAQVAALANPGQNDPNAARRQQLQAIKQEGARIEARLAALQQSLVPPAHMANLLEDLLRRNGNLKLTALTTLPVSPLVKASGEPEAGREKKSPGRPLIFKHGVEITVEGSYPDMLAYLAELEKLPWQMYWSEVKMSAADYPRVTMTITVFTLSQDKTWLSL